MNYLVKLNENDPMDWEILKTNKAIVEDEIFPTYNEAADFVELTIDNYLEELKTNFPIKDLTNEEIDWEDGEEIHDSEGNLVSKE